MADNHVRKLTTLGQSVWLDFIEREFIRTGELGALIRDDGVSGVTSNPAIFQKAFAEAGYREQIKDLVQRKQSVDDIYQALVIDDIRAAADALKGIYEKTKGQDGFVSLEVSPRLARDTDATVEEGKRLWTAVDRPNLMIKVPGTREGLEAIRRLIEEGIHVNVTLLFGVERYAEVAAAYEKGIRARIERGLPVDHLCSVASFFVSRIDSLVDAKIDALGTLNGQAARGRFGVASARAAYARHLEMIQAPSWRELEARGARPQKLLWASTGVKDPAYPDTKYIDELVYPNTITTVPPETLAVYRDHGVPELQKFDATALKRDLNELSEVLKSLNLSWREISDQLEADGVDKFVKPFDAMFASLEKQINSASAGS